MVPSNSSSRAAAKPSPKPPRGVPNNVRKFREDHMLSRAELARRASISVITLARVEEGFACRLDTKRKILLALGLKITDRDKIFFDLG